MCERDFISAEGLDQHQRHDLIHQPIQRVWSLHGDDYGLDGEDDLSDDLNMNNSDDDEEDLREATEMFARMLVGSELSGQRNRPGPSQFRYTYEETEIIHEGDDTNTEYSHRSLDLSDEDEPGDRREESYVSRWTDVDSSDEEEGLWNNPTFRASLSTFRSTRTPAISPAQTTAVSNAPASVAAATSDGTDTGGRKYSCPLCLELDRELSCIACGHVFCVSCITHALDIKSECPVCRRHARQRDIRRIYLD